jgi:YidC/Oxa1 family membrane protein insertase
MYLQQKLNPQPADPMQQKIFMVLPIVFTFLLGGFPAGLVIYWAWNNLLSIAQQWVIMRKMGVSASGAAINPGKPKPPPRGNRKTKQPSAATDSVENPSQTSVANKDKARTKNKGKTRRRRKRR